MKRFNLFGIVLAAAMAVVSCQKNPDFGPAINTGDDNRVQYETKSGDVIKDQYIVVLKEFPGRIPEGYAPGLERAREVIEGLLAENRIPADKIGFVYAFALNGFSATLTSDEVGQADERPACQLHRARCGHDDLRIANQCHLGTGPCRPAGSAT